MFLSLPSLRGTGVGRTHKTKVAPAKKAGANVSIILGHFQKCLTGFFAIQRHFATWIPYFNEFTAALSIVNPSVKRPINVLKPSTSSFIGLNVIPF